MYSDEASIGWGWAIDNLRIQLPPITAVAEPIINENSLNVFPNPSNTGIVTIDAKWKGTEASLSITNGLGQGVYTQKMTEKTPQRLNLSHLSNGLYLIKMEVGQESIIKKVIIAK